MNNDSGIDQAVKLAREMLSRPGLVVFDTETTGLSDTDEVVEIAAVNLKGEAVLDTLVQPTCPVSAEAVAIHGISAEMLADAPTMGKVVYSLMDAFKGNAFPVSYNFNFDRQMVVQSVRASFRHNTYIIKSIERLLGDQRQWRCIMETYARYHGAWSERHGSYTWQRLEVAARECQVEVEGDPHRALTDAKTALGVLRYMAREARYGESNI